MVLERFEFNVVSSNLLRVQEWIHHTLQSITSPVFNEFVIWILSEGCSRSPLIDGSWLALGESLDALAKRNHSFRVVFKGDFYSFRYGTLDASDGFCSLIASYMPLVWSNRRVKFEYAPRAANRFLISGAL